MFTNSLNALIGARGCCLASMAFYCEIFKKNIKHPKKLKPDFLR